ncbi:hypothetical protein FOMPIDRAFT_1056709 [Fomitopsis schrenkii]|uniref:Uncharacterized protein n=1 Tax=Fomitopsis schrenkii TaxID=2126942 RepID=S8DGA7_FOMSC|nr:hypothetical protein FOMPIDRAFT_1056709 [Fomitopsis schrenkii]
MPVSAEQKAMERDGFLPQLYAFPLHPDPVLRTILARFVEPPTLPSCTSYFALSANVLAYAALGKLSGRGNTTVTCAFVCAAAVPLVWSAL